MATPERAIIITGANGGVGSELTRYLLERGARNLALVCHRSSERADAILKEFDLDPNAHRFTTELTDESQLKALREGIEKNFSSVYGVVNVAGGSTNALSWKMTKEQFQGALDQNLLSSFLCSREFIPLLRNAECGRIINFSSVTGFTGIAGAAHYSAAKAGLVGLTKSLALELAPKNITVNAIVLGYFQYGLINHLTPELQDGVKSRIPLKRFGTGNEIGGMLQYLLSDDGAYTTGQILHINGGLYS